jgi:thioredoxin-dependent peroxiredoxin
MLQSGDRVPSLHAKPIFGRAITLPADLSRGPMVVIYLGPVSSPFGRELAFAVQAAFPGFDREGISVVGVTSSGLTAARDFVPRYHLLYPLLADVDGSIATSLGLEKSTSVRATARDIVTRGAGAVLAPLRHGVGPIEGDPRGPVGAFVFGRKGQVVRAWQGVSLAARPDLVDLLECARSC